MLKQVFWTLTTRVLLIAGGLISSVITARALGPDGRGVFFYWSTLVAIAIQFGNLGLHASNTYYIAKGSVKLSVLATNSLFVSIIGGLIAGLIVTIYLWITGHHLQGEVRFLIPMMLLIPAGLYFMLGCNLFVGMQHFNEYNIFELLYRYGAIAALLVAILIEPKPEYAFTALMVAALAVSVPLYLRLNYKGGGASLDLAVLWAGFGYSFRAYIAAVLSFLVLRANALMLEHYVNGVSFGVWSISAQLLDIIAVVPSTVALILFPKIVSDKRPHKLLRKNLAGVAAIMGFICIVAVVAGKWAIKLVYGEQFTSAYEMLLWGLPGAFALGLISVFSQYLAALGIPIALLVIWSVGVLGLIVLGLVLIPMYGAIGAMATWSCTYLVLLALVWGLSHRIISTQEGK